MAESATAAMAPVMNPSRECRLNMTPPLSVDRFTPPRHAPAFMDTAQQGHQQTVCHRCCKMRTRPCVSLQAQMCASSASYDNGVTTRAGCTNLWQVGAAQFSGDCARSL